MCRPSAGPPCSLVSPVPLRPSSRGGHSGSPALVGTSGHLQAQRPGQGVNRGDTHLGEPKAGQPVQVSPEAPPAWSQRQDGGDGQRAPWLWEDPGITVHGTFPRHVVSGLLGATPFLGFTAPPSGRGEEACLLCAGKTRTGRPG